MSRKIKEIYEFGGFRLDVDEHRLERIDGRTNGFLPEKAFRTLLELVRNAGTLLTKDHLLSAVWADAVVEQNNLGKAIHSIRQFLGDHGPEYKFIETIPKHGYRFIAHVKCVEIGSTEGVSQSKIVFDRRSVVWTAVVALFLLTTVLAIIYFPRKPQEKRGTNNDEARKLYMMALNLSEERGTQKVFKALEYVDKAVALDPNFALAWAAKAHLHNDVVSHSDLDAHDQYARSLKAANNALSIDPNMGDAYSAICHYKNRYEYDNIGAEKACKRALELDPDSPVAHKTYANFLYTQGRFDEAVAEIKTAMDLQPVSYRNQQMYALTLYFARRYDEAEDQFKRLIELNPDHSYIHGRLAQVLEQHGKYAEAFDYLIEMLKLQKADRQEIDRFKAAYRDLGWRGVVLEQIKSAEINGGNPFQLACLYVQVGNKDKAFEMLDKAVQIRHFQVPIIPVEPRLDLLRGDPRYKTLLSRLKIR